MIDPQKFLKVLLTSAVLGGGVSVQAAESPARLVMFAHLNWLTMFVGKYQPGKGWVQGTDFYEPPEPGAPVTLFGVSGKLAEATLVGKSRAEPNDTPADWSQEISRWNWNAQEEALAVAGQWPPPERIPTVLPLGDAESVAAVAEFLKTRGLHVQQPLLTQAFRLDLKGDQTEQTLLCAHNDASALHDDQAASIYALALLRFRRNGAYQTIPLAAQTSYKPASRSLARHQELNGVRDFYRFLAFYDIDGNGTLEIVLYRALEDATQVDVFTFDGRRVKKVLSAYQQF